MRRLIGTLLVVLVLGACSSSAKTAPSTTPGPCTDLACHMTGDSGVYGIPEPSDAAPIPSAAGLKSTGVGTIEQLTHFYQVYMLMHGWKFDAKNSTLDPKQAEAKSLGHITNAVYCKPGATVTTAIIIVGYLNDKPGGKLSYSVIDDPGEVSCDG